MKEIEINGGIYYCHPIYDQYASNDCVTFISLKRTLQFERALFLATRDGKKQHSHTVFMQNNMFSILFCLNNICYTTCIYITFIYFLNPSLESSC